MLTYDAKIIADSINESGDRLTTFELTLPKFLLAELNTHRVFSRSAASSRAIPVKKVIEQVVNNPVIPTFIGKNQAGMQAVEEVNAEERELFLETWLQARDRAVEQAERLVKQGIHKQLVNRLLEPWMWAKDIVTATHYNNFFNLRVSPNAQPEFKVVAEKMQKCYMLNIPTLALSCDYWHLPYLDKNEIELDLTTKLKVCSARCARVSYLNHDGNYDIEKDIELHDRLLADKHLSALEHLAKPFKGKCGNFTGWLQYRKLHFPEFEG